MRNRTIIALMLASLVTLGAAVASAAPAAKLDNGKIHVATCNDGKEYYNLTGDHRGACSGHKGVKVFADGTVPKSRGGKSSEYR